MEGEQLLGVEEESLEELHNWEILDLCYFEVCRVLRCTDDDCPCTELHCFKASKIRPLNVIDRPPDDMIREARHILRQRNLCHHCGVKLVPIGRARERGRDHEDWPNRWLHKKCWKSIMFKGDITIGGNETDEES